MPRREEGRFGEVRQPVAPQIGGMGCRICHPPFENILEGVFLVSMSGLLLMHGRSGSFGGGHGGKHAHPSWADKWWLVPERLTVTYP